MTREELARELDEMRLRAWHQARLFVQGKLDPQTAGYVDYHHAVIHVITQSAQEVEAKLKTWEKANPL